MPASRRPNVQTDRICRRQSSQGIRQPEAGHALIRLAPPDFNFKELQIADLPLYNQDDDRNQAPEVQRFKSELRAVDAVMFVTPEYNRSIPGILKNAIDHASRPYGQNAWSGKPAGVIGASPGAISTAVAQLHLRTILAYLDMPTLGQPEAYIHVKDGFFDDSGQHRESGTAQVPPRLDGQVRCLGQTPDRPLTNG